ncbi:MAG TPA: hypothetical protein VI457_16175 [Methylococcaceae bacterium]|nr:hypothetical protein [Methylococcaceae bacterium]
MSVALRLYEQLTEAGEDKTRAHIFAEAFEQLEERYPALKEVATQGNLRETELRLQKEIEGVRLEIGQVRLEIKEVELRLRKEIEGVRLEIKEVEANLRKDIEGVRLEVKGMDVKIAETRADLIRWVVGVGILQTTLITGLLLKVTQFL